MSQWMEHLNSLGILDGVKMDSGGSAALVTVDDDAKDTTELETRQPSPPQASSAVVSVAPYRALDRARDRLDLEGILDAAQAAYEAGDLSIVVVEDLAIQAGKRAQALPVAAVDIWADELLGDGWKDTCPCCGRSTWRRDSYGNRKCGVCHPQPRATEAVPPGGRLPPRGGHHVSGFFSAGGPFSEKNLSIPSLD